jgi:hypothetical protein
MGATYRGEQTARHQVEEVAMVVEAAAVITTMVEVLAALVQK